VPQLLLISEENCKVVKEGDVVFSELYAVQHVQYVQDTGQKLENKV
jgi:hypothetical protein